jgi:hypothetical protein
MAPTGSLPESHHLPFPTPTLAEDVLQAIQTLLNARRDRVRMLSAAWRAYYRLKTATGEMP